MRRILLLSALAGLTLTMAAPTMAGDKGFFFRVGRLVSDIAGLAAVTDPNLKNPWGVSYAPTGPFWVSDQVSSAATLYNGNSGTPVPLVVTTPKATTGPNGPTGQVFNGNAADFHLANG